MEIKSYNKNQTRASPVLRGVSPGVLVSKEGPIGR